MLIRHVLALASDIPLITNTQRNNVGTLSFCSDGGRKRCCRLLGEVNPNAFEVIRSNRPAPNDDWSPFPVGAQELALKLLFSQI